MKSQPGRNFAQMITTAFSDKKFIFAIESGSDPWSIAAWPSAALSLILDAKEPNAFLNYFQIKFCLKSHDTKNFAQFSAASNVILGAFPWHNCQAILWGEGPGSFSNLRGSASLFQTIAACFKIPNFQVNSLKAYAMAHLLKTNATHDKCAYRIIVARELSSRNIAAVSYRIGPEHHELHALHPTKNFLMHELLNEIVTDSKTEPILCIVDYKNENLKKEFELIAGANLHCIYATSLDPQYLQSFLLLKARDIAQHFSNESKWMLHFSPNYLQ